MIYLIAFIFGFIKGGWAGASVCLFICYMLKSVHTMARRRIDKQKYHHDFTMLFFLLGYAENHLFKVYKLKASTQASHDFLKMIKLHYRVRYGIKEKDSRDAMQKGHKASEALMKKNLKWLLNYSHKENRYQCFRLVYGLMASSSPRFCTRHAWKDDAFLKTLVNELGLDVTRVGDICAEFLYTEQQTQTKQSQSNNSINDDYKILEIKKGVTFSEIKQARRRLLNQYHPDKQSKATSAQKKHMEDKVYQINTAFERIKAYHGWS